MHISEDVVKNHEKGISHVKAEDLFDYLKIYNAKLIEITKSTQIALDLRGFYHSNNSSVSLAPYLIPYKMAV